MWAFLLATSVAFLASPIVIGWYKKNNWVEDPQKQIHVKKTHEHAVPRGGGLIVFISILVSSLLLLDIDTALIAILSGASLLALTGFLDDLYDIHPAWRLGAGLTAAVIVVLAGIGIRYVTNPFGPGVIYLDQWQIPYSLLGLATERNLWILADLFAVTFIIWNMNIVNWAKGVDGQLPGFVSVAALIIGFLSYQFIDDPTQFNTAHLSFIIAGAYLGYLYWNWYPQRSMPGYGGGALAGYFLAVLAILSGAKVATTLMVLAIPTADALFTILRRLKAGKSPIWGDRGHLHHKLIDVLGWGKRRIALFYWFSSAFLGILSLYLNTTGKIVTLLLVFAFVFGFLIWAKMKLIKKNAITQK
jgi:UDP-GlcNAc:undecaprenyl-phosphate/decaprenyl-phosphate GlcNAc-1-phosphate transferase